MRLSLWLLALSALMTGGCVFPCSNGACITSGEPRYVPPVTRFFGTEKLLPQTVVSAGCSTGRCEPSPYLTFSKYWPFLDTWTSTAMARRCADRYLLKQQIRCRRWISKHYKSGFRAAFVDIANGESGEVPAVPPPKYWNTHYRTENGKRYVEMYFDGYRAGSALAASELNPMKTIGASYDWSIEKPKGPCAPSGGLNSGGCSPGGVCSPGAGIAHGSGWAPGAAGYEMQQQTGMPLAGSQSYQMGAMPPQQPPVFSMNPQPPAPGIGPPNTYPGPGNYGPAPTFDPNLGRQQNPYPNPHDQFGAGPGTSQSPQSYVERNQVPVPGLSAPSAGGFGSGRAPSTSGRGLPSPGYSTPGGASDARPPLQNASPQTPPSPIQSPRPIVPLTNLPQPNAGQSGAASRQPGGALTPGFSGTPPGQVLPGKLGPPDQFKSDPPAFQVSPPQR